MLVLYSALVFAAPQADADVDAYGPLCRTSKGQAAVEIDNAHAALPKKNRRKKRGFLESKKHSLNPKNPTSALVRTMRDRVARAAMPEASFCWVRIGRRAGGEG
jgi:hypothetical protein